MRDGNKSISLSGSLFLWALEVTMRDGNGGFDPFKGAPATILALEVTMRDGNLSNTR